MFSQESSLSPTHYSPWREELPRGFLFFRPLEIFDHPHPEKGSIEYMFAQKVFLKLQKIFYHPVEIFVNPQYKEGGVVE